jgi:pyruvate/2-oxoglutarate dehydrogenase complex dihydrolipoamide dehydrogenase (E3) component
MFERDWSVPGSKAVGSSIRSKESRLLPHRTLASNQRRVRDNTILVENAHPLSWKNPEPKATYDLVVIGAGPAGLFAAKGAPRLGKSVALIERDLLGGNSLNAGSVPSKAIIRTSRWYADLRDAENFGAIAPDPREPDFPAAMKRMRHLRARLSSYNSADRLRAAGVDVFFGNAQFVDSNALMVSGLILRFKKALIATGAHPTPSAIPGLEEVGYFTSNTIFEITKCPNRLLIVGGGPLGCELAQAFQRLGVRVIIAQNEPKFLPMEERDAAQLLSDALARSGVEIHLNTTVTSVRSSEGMKFVDLISNENKITVVVDDILSSVGRQPNVEGLCLEAAGVEYDAAQGIHVNEFLQTSNTCVYAAGDVCMEYKFTHAAEAYAQVALQNAFLSDTERQNSLTIPWCTYTDPEVAHVGLYVWQAHERSIPVSTITVLMNDVDRAILDGEEDGFVKVHIRDGTDHILGATIVSRHAGEMISSLALAMNAGIGLRMFAKVMLPYPTQSVAIKMVADAFERTRVARETAIVR